MKYQSTRGQVKGLSFKDAVMMGLADDGGLLVPETLPLFTKSDLQRMASMNYQELAFEVISRFVDDIEPSTLRELINKSYSTFDTENVIPVVAEGNIFIAEIFHGPTFAFKDIALQFLGNLFEHILKERGEKMNIIGATSGDTGSAAIAGVRGKENINIFILYPEGRVSPVQELQMASVEDDNVHCIALEGTFDDCQGIVKEIFGDLDFKKKHSLGAVNSINWARVLAQIVYYFHAYFRACEDGCLQGSKIIVPTGNFGNIFAGFLAKKMGLPISKLILATNENNILTRFVQDGDYSLKDVVQTYSPSMDIQLASNFERYLFYMFGGDSEKVSSLMNALKEHGELHFNYSEMELVHNDFGTFSTNNDMTLETIRNFYSETGYVLDPHTACGIAAAYNAPAEIPYICLSTAHPAKFPEAVNKAIGKDPEQPEGIKKLIGAPLRKTLMENSIDKVKEFVEDKLASK